MEHEFVQNELYSYCYRNHLVCSRHFSCNTVNMVLSRRYIFRLFNVFTYFTKHFYVLLLTDRLVLKNGVYSFMRREYLFKDVVKIRMKRNRNIYMQVFTKKDEEKVKSYCIDVVAPKDYKLLIEMLIIKGIVVETEGLEMYLS